MSSHQPSEPDLSEYHSRIRPNKVLKKMTRADLALFIEEVPSGSLSREDWERIAVNHYRDIEFEEARRELVRYVGGHKKPCEAVFKNTNEALLDIARRLRDMR